MSFATKNQINEDAEPVQQQQQQSLDNNNNNNNDTTFQKLSFEVRLPNEFLYSDSLPYCPQKGCYAFPAGLATERTLFGWQLKLDESYSDAAGNQRARRYRCASTFFQCDKCLKIVAAADETTRTKKRKIPNDNDDNNNNNNNNEIEKKCTDSPQCDGVLRLSNCGVVSNLVIRPFLATLEVSADHLHSQLPQKHNLVQITSVHLQNIDSSIIGSGGNYEREFQQQTIVEKQTKIISSSSSSTTINIEQTASNIILSAINNVINWSSSSPSQQQTYLEAELLSLSLFNNNDDNDNSLSTEDKSTLIKTVRCELLFVTLALAKSEIDNDDAQYWRQHVSLSLRQRASSQFVRFPWFATLFAGVLFVIQQHQSTIFDVHSDNDQNYMQLVVKRLLKASDHVSMDVVLTNIDNPSSSSTMSSSKSIESNLRSISTTLAKRIAFPSERRTIIQQQLTSLATSSIITKISSSSPQRTNNRSFLITNVVTNMNSMNLNVVADNTTTRISSLSTMTTSNQSSKSSLIDICRRLSDAYCDMKLFSAVSEEFVALFLNAVIAETKRIVAIFREKRQQQQQIAQSIQLSSFSATLSAGNVYQLSVRDSNDWLGALAIVCSNEEKIDDIRLELRVVALLELCEHRQHYIESIGGLKLLCDLIDDLVGNNWQTPLLRNESLFVFANVWKGPIVIIDIQTKNEKSIVALPLRHKVSDCVGTFLLLGHRSNDEKFNVIQQRSDCQQPPIIANALLPSVNCVSLTLPFVNHFITSINIIVLDDNQQSSYPYSTTTTTTTMTPNRLLNLLSSAKTVNVDDNDDIVLSDSSFDRACEVRVRDLRRLLTGQWFNDELINALVLLAIRSTQFDAFSSSITQKLTQSTTATTTTDDWINRFHSFHGKTFQQLLTQKISILIPWNSPGHWSLLWIDPNQREIWHVDSLGRNAAIPNLHLARRLFKLININDFKLSSDIESPRQQDVVNCGAFVILNAWKLAHQQTLSSSTLYFNDATVMRLALAHSIINSSSNWPL